MRLPEGWVDANELVIPDRMTVVVKGRWKTGKTNFSLTAPPPIAHINLDVGLEGVIEKFRKLKEIYTNNYIYRTEMGASTQALAQPVWDKLKEDYLYFLRSKEVRTVVLDTESEAFDLIRFARLGSLAMPRESSYKYGPVNAEFRELLRLAFVSDKNLILIKKMKDEYIKDVRTGGDEPAGFKDTSYLVQINLLAWRDGMSGPFHLTIEDCRQNPDVAGMDLEGEMCNWDFLKVMVMG
jgi:hypothetical protein